jgi:hypothetical protein
VRHCRNQTCAVRIHAGIQARNPDRTHSDTDLRSAVVFCYGSSIWGPFSEFLHDRALAELCITHSQVQIQPWRRIEMTSRRKPAREPRKRPPARHDRRHAPPPSAMNRAHWPSPLASYSGGSPTSPHRQARSSASQLRPGPAARDLPPRPPARLRRRRAGRRRRVLPSLV